jgi:hypothetical protein
LRVLRDQPIGKIIFDALSPVISKLSLVQKCQTSEEVLIVLMSSLGVSYRSTFSNTVVGDPYELPSKHQLRART